MSLLEIRVLTHIFMCHFLLFSLVAMSLVMNACCHLRMLSLHDWGQPIESCQEKVSAFLWKAILLHLFSVRRVKARRWSISLLISCGLHELQLLFLVLFFFSIRVVNYCDMNWCKYESDTHFIFNSMHKFNAYHCVVRSIICGFLCFTNHYVVKKFSQSKMRS